MEELDMSPYEDSSGKTVMDNKYKIDPTMPTSSMEWICPLCRRSYSPACCECPNYNGEILAK